MKALIGIAIHLLGWALILTSIDGSVWLGMFGMYILLPVSVGFLIAQWEELNRKTAERRRYYEFLEQKRWEEEYQRRSGPYR